MVDKLNVFTYSYGPWKHITNWPKNIWYFFRSFKYAWQRATKGYCDWDLWDLDYFYASLFRDSLKEFAKNLCGYPYRYKTEAEWSATLNELSEHFGNYLSEETPLHKEAMEFWDQWTKDSEYWKASTSYVVDNDELAKKFPETQKLHDAWLAKEQEADLFSEKELEIALKQFVEIYRDLWD